MTGTGLLTRSLVMVGVVVVWAGAEVLPASSGAAASPGVAASAPAAGEEIVFDLQQGRLVLDREVRARVEFGPDTAAAGAAGRPARPALVTPRADSPAFALVDDQGVPRYARRAKLEGRALTVTFDDDAWAVFDVYTQKGIALFELRRLETPRPPQRLSVLRLALPNTGTSLSHTLNAGSFGGRFLAVMGCDVNAQAVLEHNASQWSDSPGCSHTFTRSTEARSGKVAARFDASAGPAASGWSYRGSRLPAVLDLRGLTALRAWVKGDGKGQALKLQLGDTQGGARDAYVPIDFTGWKQVTLAQTPYDKLAYDRVSHLNFYYNGLPAGQSVSCLIDRVEAIVARDGRETVVLLEDFESPHLPVFGEGWHHLEVRTHSRHKLQPCRVALVACPQEEFLTALQRMQEASGIAVPHPGGVWNKVSPWTRKSYLFLTSLSEAQVEQGIDLARRGGFHLVLVGQESWCHSTGHYDVSTARFPDGLAGLKRAFARFRQAGVKVGLHFLGPSIYPPDKYLTPVPDPRLVKDAFATLAADVDENAANIPVAASPEAFPPEDGGYMGKGSVLQIDNELIWYKSRTTAAPFAFHGCVRGYLGTKKAPHAKGSRVAHLLKSYGYFLFDMDTTLLHEAADHFARVANALRVEMIYFDGAERLQGDHWYYNPLLIRTFYDKLEFRDLQLQASSYSHSSWHLLSRTASADGHGDLKGYLDERSAWLNSFSADAMPLEIGWYYGYDTEATPDMYEYVLGASIGYDCPISFQVSVAAARAHPFTGEILDLIRRYDELREGGKVPQAMRDRLRIAKELGGKKEPAERENLLHHRREFRLVAGPAGPVFRRVHYEPWNWHEAADVGGARTGTFEVTVPEGGAQAGVQVHARQGKPAGYAPPAGAKIVAPWVEVGGKRYTWKTTLEPGQYLTALPGQAPRRNAPTPASAQLLAAPETLNDAGGGVIPLSAGRHVVTFGHAGTPGTPLRVRLVMDGPESYPARQ